MDERPYHHGDLANALVAAALPIVEQHGAEAVSMRELAASLGVSRGAPYRHFADRDALLAAVAARGFEQLNAGYEAALAMPADGQERLRQATRVYFGFALRRPGLHRLMFESDLLTRRPPPAVLIPPANRAYHLLWEAVRGAFPHADEREVKLRTVVMWSTTYGFLALRGAGRFKDFMIEPWTDQQLSEEMVAAAARAGG
jgi:AcrR family transcriptional regulator